MNGTPEDQPPATAAPVSVSDDADVRSVSSDNDNERVREKLKQTTIAPAAASASRPGSGADTADLDHVMSSSEDPPRRTRKRSHDESDDDKTDAQDAERRKLNRHERKRSREITEADRLRAGSGLERVKTPPTHPEEAEGIAERVASPVGSLERKRSLGKLDKEEEEDQKKKISKTEEDRRKAEEEEKATKPAADAESAEGSSETKLPESSGFANTSSKSPFATTGAGVNIFAGASSPSIFANSKFGALSGSSASPFGTLGAKTSQSPFGTFGAKSASSGFGSGSAFGSSSGGSPFGGSSVFGSSAKSQPPKKPFGAPDDDGEKTDEDDNESEDGDERKDKCEDDAATAKALGLKEQEVMTGEEDETTIFKCFAKIFHFDRSAQTWKERGKGTLKLNRTTPSVDDFGLASDDEGEKKQPAKKMARLIMRTEGTLVVILNGALFKDMKVPEDEPNGTQLTLQLVENGEITLIAVKVRTNTAAKELYKYVLDLKKELWG